MTSSLGFFGGGGAVDYSDSDTDSGSEDEDEDEDVSRGAVEAAPSSEPHVKVNFDRDGGGVEDEEEIIDAQQGDAGVGTDGKAHDKEEEEESSGVTKKTMMSMANTNTSSAGLLPSFHDALRSTEGAPGSFTAAGSTLGSAVRTGRVLSGAARRVAEGNEGITGGGYYSGTLGAKGVAGGVAVVANLTSDVQKSREVTPGVAERLMRGMPGRGAGEAAGGGGLGGLGGGGNNNLVSQIARLTGARMHVEHLEGLHPDDKQPRRVMVVGNDEADVSRCLDLIDEMMREEATAVTRVVSCPTHCVGAVIGSGGVIIRGIQNMTGARVVVQRQRGGGGGGSHGSHHQHEMDQDQTDQTDQTTPRVIQVSGAPKAVARAVTMVREKIYEARRSSGWVTAASAKRDREEEKLATGDGEGEEERGRNSGGKRRERYGDAAECVTDI